LLLQVNNKCGIGYTLSGIESCSDEVKYMSLFSSIDRVIKNHSVYNNDNYYSYYNTNLF